MLFIPTFCFSSQNGHLYMPITFLKFDVQLISGVGDASPISRKRRWLLEIDEESLQVLCRVIKRGLNRNQRLILLSIPNHSATSFTSFLISLSNSFEIPLSTLKLNAKILEALGLINKKKVSLTNAGKLIVEFLDFSEVDRKSFRKNCGEI